MALGEGIVDRDALAVREGVTARAIILGLALGAGRYWVEYVC